MSVVPNSSRVRIAREQEGKTQKNWFLHLERIQMKKGASFISFRTYQKAEKGERIAADSLQNIADALGIPYQTLLKSESDVVPELSIIPQKPLPYKEHPYALLQTRELVGRKYEMSELSNWIHQSSFSENPSKVFLVVGLGGQGKSALAWNCFSQLSKNDNTFSGSAWWSFYEADARFERFVAQTLAYVSSANLSDILKMPTHIRECELLKWLDQEPFFIVLDVTVRRTTGPHSV